MLQYTAVHGHHADTPTAWNSTRNGIVVPLSMSRALTTITPPKRTNSERGKEFRAKRKQYEASLVGLVTALRTEVQDLQLLRAVRQQRAFQARSNLQGPLVRLVQEYFSLFQCGMSMDNPSRNTMVATQESFLRSAMREDLDFGGIQSGVEALMDQWRRYSAYHSKFRVSVVHMEIDGPEESPVVTVVSNLRVQFSAKTFQYVFPHVASNTTLVNKYIGLEVTYRGVNRFQFTSDGRIVVYDSAVGFVNALLEAGMSLADVGILVQDALIADEYLLGENPESPSCSPVAPEDEEEGGEEEPMVVEIPKVKRSRQLDIEYLLS